MVPTIVLDQEGLSGSVPERLGFGGAEFSVRIRAGII